MEKFFLNTNFHYVDVVPVTNGKSITSTRLANNISSLFRAKNPNADLIIVWVDGEGRPEPVSEIRSQIVQAMIESGASPDRLLVGVPDEMTENWMLSDEVMIREHFNLPDYKYAHEGQNGKHAIKMMHKDRNENYKETGHGVKLLKKMRLTRSAIVSESAKAFCADFDIDCWWVRTNDATQV